MKEIIYNNLEDTKNILFQQSECDGIEYSTWTRDKANLKYNEKLPNFPIINNFLYWCNLGVNDTIKVHKKWKVEIHKIVYFFNA